MTNNCLKKVESFKNYNNKTSKSTQKVTLLKKLLKTNKQTQKYPKKSILTGNIFSDSDSGVGILEAVDLRPYHQRAGRIQ